jgi:iron(III)-salmochelin esterase
VIRRGRRILLGLFLLGGGACRKDHPQASSSTEPVAHASESTVAGATSARDTPLPAAGNVRQVVLDFAATSVGAEKAVVVVPEWGAPGERFPVLVALHGRGESVRGVAAGAYGWIRDYDLEHAIARLRAPPLTRDDFKGFVSDARLARINEDLGARPFRGLIVACPWVPDLIAAERRDLDAANPFADFVTGQLVPRVLSELPDAAQADALGIDGVSLGGRAALLVGLRYADRFRALGTLQAAVQEPEAVPLAHRARAAMASSPRLKLRLLTSDQDYFRGPIAALAAALTAEQVPHEHRIVVGPHDYPFNRGPGGIEMLLWHDRVLRGEDPI